MTLLCKHDRLGRTAGAFSVLAALSLAAHPVQAQAPANVLFASELPTSANANTGAVLTFDLATGAPLTPFLTSGTTSDKGLAYYSPDGGTTNNYFVSQGTGVITERDTNARVQKTFGTSGQFANLNSINLDGAGNVYTTSPSGGGGTLNGKIGVFLRGADSTGFGTYTASYGLTAQLSGTSLTVQSAAVNAASSTSGTVNGATVGATGTAPLLQGNTYVSTATTSNTLNGTGIAFTATLPTTAANQNLAVSQVGSNVTAANQSVFFNNAFYFAGSTVTLDPANNTSTLINGIFSTNGASLTPFITFTNVYKGAGGPGGKTQGSTAGDISFSAPTGLAFVGNSVFVEDFVTTKLASGNNQASTNIYKYSLAGGAPTLDTTFGGGNGFISVVNAGAAGTTNNAPFNVGSALLVAPVPEPSQAAALGLGVLGLTGLILRARRTPLVA